MFRNATDTFETKVSAEDNKVERVEIYTNQVNYNVKETLLDELKNSTIDYITFTSSSTFKNLMKLLGGENTKLIENIKKVSIGEITTETIKKAGFEEVLQAEIPSIDSVIEVIKNDVNKNCQ